MNFLKRTFLNQAHLLMLLLVAPLLVFTSCGNDDDAPTPPPTNIVDVASGNANFSLLVEAVQRAGLVNALSDANATLTVFAPTNAAFEAAGYNSAAIANETPSVLADILLYHVLATELTSTQLATGTVNTILSGNELMYINTTSGVKINGSVNVTTPDIQADNGVIHAVDAVILPPKSAAQTATDAGLTYLVAAITRSGIDLSALPQPLTIFAPSNQAFIDAGFPTIADIEGAPVDAVADIIRYHVITGGRTFSTDLATDISVAAADGNSLYFGIDGSDVFVNEAQITGTDILTTDGVVHLVDRVIGQGTIADFASRNPEFSSLFAGIGASATTTADLAATLGDAAQTLTVFAPKNAAIATFLTGLGATGVNDVSGDNWFTVIAYHAVGSVVFSGDITDGATPATVEGNTVTLNLPQGGGVTVTDLNSGVSNVTTADIKLKNGVVHVIDAVLNPL